MRISSVAWVSLLPCLALGATHIPELTLPQGVGVNIHFVSGHEKDLDLIAAAGFKFIRMDFGWAGIERKKGEYNWEGYEQLLRNLEQRGISAVFILDYSNPLYEETISSRDPITGGTRRTTASPQHPESVEAFAKWAAAAVEHFKNRAVIWEIWNEPNIHFWAPKPDVEQYVTLALATSRAIRKVDPGATLVGPATSTFPWDFLEGCFKAGLLEYWDAVSVHPYRDYKKGPETAEADYSRLRELIKKYAPAGKAGRIPILNGEWGYASHDKGVSLEKQAAFAARQHLANVLSGVPLSIWYDWKNDGTDPKEREHNFGTVLPDLEPKLAYLAIQKLTRELGGYKIQERITMDSPQDFVLRCADGTGNQKLAAWTTGERHQATVPGVSEQSDARDKGKSLTLEITEHPQYVRLSKP